MVVDSALRSSAVLSTMDTRSIAVIFYLCQTIFALTEQKKGFLVTAPSTLLISSQENVCVSLHNHSSPVQVSLKLMGVYSGQLLATASSTVDSLHCLKLSVPFTDEQVASLVVRLQSPDPQLTGNTALTLALQSEPLVVLVTTDKPVYRAGQEVKFRIFSLNHRLKPHNDKIQRVWIETPSGVQVQQWRNVDVIKHGLVQLQFALEKEPFLGQWKIKVEHKSSEVVEKSFLVKEYVPATFEVFVESPADILPDSDELTWNICAKYSYGEVVQGEARVEIKLQSSLVVDQPSINHALKLNSWTGCVALSVRGSELGLADPSVHPTGVQVVATVTEKGTGISHSYSVLSSVHNQPFEIHFQCSKYFKPGLPYKGNIVMKTMSGKPRPRVGERIQVCVKVRHQSQLAMKLLHCWNSTSDFSSHVVFSLPDIDHPFDVHLISIIASAVDYPTKLYPGSSEVMVLQPSATLYVKPWFSPSHSFLDVASHTSLVCGLTRSLPVYYSVPSVDTATPTFYYLVEARGDILTMKSIVPKEESVLYNNEVSSAQEGGMLVRTWRLPLTVTPEMSPKAKLSIYYVREDGEVVATSSTLVLDRCFQNKVRVRWEELQVAPGANAQLCIRASPNSVCGVTVIDRQIMFNTSQSAALSDSEAVWNLLERFDLQKPVRDQRLYCLNKNHEAEERPPDYDLRRRRSLFMAPKDYSDHVDAITAFDDLGVSVTTNLVLETRPCMKNLLPEEMFERSFGIFWNEEKPSVVADNLLLVTQDESKSRSKESFQSLVRDFFPETWIWSLVHIGREGEVTLPLTTPDSITSWDSRVFCVSEREGLGLAHPSALSVFRPFFLHVEAPFSLKRGENVTIKVIVYNYMHHSLPITVRFPETETLQISPRQEERFCVEPLSPLSCIVAVSAQSSGVVNLTVQAVIESIEFCGPSDIHSASDTVIKQLLVRDEGFVQQKSQSALICPSEDSEPSVMWNLQLPQADNLVRGSARLQFSVAADLFGPSIDNLDSLVLLPMGCGEQNLARLAPNLFVLKYMDAMHYADQQLRDKALKNIKKGYQRQLIFRRSDGSFSAFGDKDEIGSLWLTAAVVRILAEARTVTDVDEDTIHSSSAWITRQQLENGCFPPLGQLFHSEIMGGESEAVSTATLSALVVANLATARITLPPAFRSSAELCLASGVDSAEPLVLALTCLALTRLDLRPKAETAMVNLMRLVVVENDLIHWGKPYGSVSDNIVTTSYAVLSLVQLGGAQNLLTARKAVRWISIHRNENGGFVSTQDTVVALEALTAYMTALPPVNRTELVVVVTGHELRRTFRLADENKLVQQQLITTDIPATLTAAVVGEGCAYVQSVLKYNVHRVEAGGWLELRVSTASVSTVDPCSVQELKMCASTANSSASVSMALLSIMMVTGFHPDRAQLRRIEHPHIKKWEEEDDQISFYLSDINNLPLCLTLVLVRKFEVESPLPAEIRLTDYYRPEISTSKTYSTKCISITPLDEPLADDPMTGEDSFDNFHNVDFELETPEGVEGPKPVYSCPANSKLPGC